MTVPLSIHAWLRQAEVERMLNAVPAGASMLEIGAGQGAAGVLLSRRFDYLGLEPDPTSFAVAADRMRRHGHGRVEPIAVEGLDVGSQFDIVCAFEVLEHIEDDRGALRAWAAHVRPCGFLLLSVPANPARFGPTDEHAGHFRRYSRATLASTVAAAGLSVDAVAAYGFPVGYALETARNLIVARRASHDSIGDRTAASGRWLQPGNRLAPFTHAAAMPWMVVQRPFAGTSLGTGLVARLRVS